MDALPASMSPQNLRSIDCSPLQLGRGACAVLSLPARVMNDAPVEEVGLEVVVQRPVNVPAVGQHPSGCRTCEHMYGAR